MPTGVGATLERRINLYEVLQVSSNASPEVIQAAYRALARSYHPDVNPSPDAAYQMRQLNAAYSVLSDATRRARYDAVRLRPMRARGDAQPRPSAPAAAAEVTRGPARGSGTRPPSISPGAPLAHAHGPRLGRVMGMVVFLVLVLGALIYGLYYIAGVLDDEPSRAMIPNAEMAQSYAALNRLSTEH
jgi:DnaJ domain